MDTLRCNKCGGSEGYDEKSFGRVPGMPCASMKCWGALRETRKKPLQQDVLRSLPTDAKDRKALPITTGVLDYFPAALAAVAELSKKGNDQHNPGEPLRWARHKSTDHADCIVRHLIDRGTRDSDGIRHTAKVAWRALALLQEEIEAEAGFKPA